MSPDLRLIRYFVAVAEVGNVTRAAERLSISQPALSTAIRQLEAQLGVELLDRRARRVGLTPAGELLLRRGRELLEHADAVVEEVRERHASPAGRLRLGVSPTARYGLAPALLTDAAAQAPAIMLYASEDTTGALLRDVVDGRLDLAIVFCAPRPVSEDLELVALCHEPAVVHLPAEHPLATRHALALEDLADETILVAATADSGGFTERVLDAFRGAGVEPRVRADPYPDLGLQAVREGLGVVVYARSAFPAQLPGSAFVRLEPELTLPFELAYRRGTRNASLRHIVSVASTLVSHDAA